MNKQAMDTILDSLGNMNLKEGTITTTRGRSPKDHVPGKIVNDEGNDQSQTYIRD